MTVGERGEGRDVAEILAIAAVAQPWLNFTGLVLDFTGVILLAIEWRIAIVADREEAEILEQQERMRPRPMPAGFERPKGPHDAVFEDMRARRRVQERLRRGQAAREARRGWFAFALALIAIGFLLQIIGSFPLDQL